MTKAEKENIILNYMKSLDIDRAEAEQMFEDDYSDTILPEVAELTKKAKQNIKNYTEGDKTHNKGKNRVRVVDNEKLQLLQIMGTALTSNGCLKTEIEKEVNLHFTFNGNAYSIKLTKHRPPKK